MILLPSKYTNLIISSLDLIRYKLDVMFWNTRQRRSPFDNTGDSYVNETFSVRAYDWIGDNEIPNFNYKNIIHVYWYKYAGRGVTAYIDEAYDFNIDLLADMVNDCIDSLRKDFGENYAD